MKPTNVLICRLINEPCLSCIRARVTQFSFIDAKSFLTQYKDNDKLSLHDIELDLGKMENNDSVFTSDELFQQILNCVLIAKNIHLFSKNDSMEKEAINLSIEIDDLKKKYNEIHELNIKLQKVESELSFALQSYLETKESLKTVLHEYDARYSEYQEKRTLLLALHKELDKEAMFPIPEEIQHEFIQLSNNYPTDSNSVIINNKRKAPEVINNISKKKKVEVHISKKKQLITILGKILDYISTLKLLSFTQIAIDIAKVEGVNENAIKSLISNIRGAKEELINSNRMMMIVEYFQTALRDLDIPELNSYLDELNIII